MRFVRLLQRWSSSVSAAAAAAVAPTSVRIVPPPNVPEPVQLLGTVTHVKAASGLTAPFTVSVVGAPMDMGQRLKGPADAPPALRSRGLENAAASNGWRWEDRGDVAIAHPHEPSAERKSNAKNAFAVCSANFAISREVANAARDGNFVLTLGGDHSVALGSVSGILSERPTVGVIWVDAHADINDPAHSLSGHIHGMPLSFLLKLTDPLDTPGAEWLKHVPPLAASSLVYVGLRDLDAAEKATIRKLGIRAFTMRDIDRLGIGKCMEQALDHLCGKAERPLHVSFDVDAIDPSVAPATGTAVVGGMSYREAHYVCESAAESGLLGSFDLVEINPLLGPRPMGAGSPAASISSDTVALGVELVASALGKSIL